MSSPPLTSDQPDPAAPPLLRLYGVLGLAPFWLAPLAGFLRPELAAPARQALSVYGAVILSFLAGARLGMTLVAARPSPRTISLSMVPPLLGWALVLAPLAPTGLRLVGLALALVIHAIWDSRAEDAPDGYSRLRWTLTFWACGGLLAGAALLHG